MAKSYPSASAFLKPIRNAFPFPLFFVKEICVISVYIFRILKVASVAPLLITIKSFVISNTPSMTVFKVRSLLYVGMITHILRVFILCSSELLSSTFRCV